MRRALRQIPPLLREAREQFIAWADNMDMRGKAGEFGKWPWQRDYGLWPWQRRKR